MRKAIQIATLAALVTIAASLPGCSENPTPQETSEPSVRRCKCLDHRCRTCVDDHGGCQGCQSSYEAQTDTSNPIYNLPVESEYEHGAKR